MTSENSYYLRGHQLKISRDADQSEFEAFKLGTSRAWSGVRDDNIADTLEDNYSSEDALGEAEWQSRENSMDTASTQILEEIEKRARALGDLYPFKINGDVITHQQSDTLLYEFLLCTCVSPSLTKGRFVDFPRHFERIATELTANFLGPNTKFYHVGFPNRHRRFKAANLAACQMSGELKWRPEDDLPDAGPRQGDEGVDYILWKDFECGRTIGQPFYFGQCACGNDWDTKLNDVSERYFKWFAKLLVKPTKVFAVPFVVPDIKLREVSRDAGIVMDRIRLVKAATAGPHYQSDYWQDPLFDTLCLVAAA